MKQISKSFVLLLMMILLTGFSWKDSPVLCPARNVLNSTSENAGHDFALTDQNNKPFRLSQLRGIRALKEAKRDEREERKKEDEGERSQQKKKATGGSSLVFFLAIPPPPPGGGRGGGKLATPT